ncbi:hypothetical protein IFR05_014365 [Cadophora sp. M221]|nr:hypothetical protein IFR05_014365 [Cadophora sp. M221]
MDDETSSRDSFDNGPRTNTANAKFNREVIERLQVALQQNPEVNLLSVIPSDYINQLRGVKPNALPKPKSCPKPPRRPDFCRDLVARAKTATVIHELSEATTLFLSKYLEPNGPFQDPTQCLVAVLTRMISGSEKVWEGQTRGVVLKCDENLVAKIISSNDDYTDVRIMFMTYFPCITLEKAWGSLTHDDKVLIQQQLDEIFCKLRQLKNNGGRMGGVGGEGVKEDHRFSHSSKGIITTPEQFKDFRFSVSQAASTSWITFFRSFLPRPKEDCVFTHGDVRLANIMVKTDDDNNFVVSGIIDWEDSGFYPEYFESTRVLYMFCMDSDVDWYAYLPACISPARHPMRWLVNRLREHTIN